MVWGVRVWVRMGRGKETGKKTGYYGFDGWKGGADYADVDFDVGPEGGACVVAWGGVRKVEDR